MRDVHLRQRRHATVALAVAQVRHRFGHHVLEPDCRTCARGDFQQRPQDTETLAADATDNLARLDAQCPDLGPQPTAFPFAAAAIAASQTHLPLAALRLVRQPVVAAFSSAEQLDDALLVGVNGSLRDLDGHLAAPLPDGM